MSSLRIRRLSHLTISDVLQETVSREETPMDTPSSSSSYRSTIYKPDAEEEEEKRTSPRPNQAPATQSTVGINARLAGNLAEISGIEPEAVKWTLSSFATYWEGANRKRLAKDGRAVHFTVAWMDFREDFGSFLSARDRNFFPKIEFHLYRYPGINGMLLEDFKEAFSDYLVKEPATREGEPRKQAARMPDLIEESKLWATFVITQAGFGLERRVDWTHRDADRTQGTPYEYSCLLQYKRHQRILGRRRERLAVRVGITIGTMTSTAGTEWLITHVRFPVIDGTPCRGQESIAHPIRFAFTFVSSGSISRNNDLRLQVDWSTTSEKSKDNAAGSLVLKAEPRGGLRISFNDPYSAKYFDLNHSV